LWRRLNLPMMQARDPMSKPAAADPALAVPQQDLIAHHRPIQAELEQAACRVIASGRYIQGPEVEALETEVARAAGVGHAIGLSSGTDALLVLLMALELRPGDEVVTTPFSFFATAGAVARLGGRPVFADVDPDTLNLDPARAAAALGPRTRAVITVDLFGRLASTDGLAQVCAARGLPIIEDAAQSIGARAGLDGPRVGERPLAATLSFFPAKNLGALGDAGMLLTNDAALARRVRLLRTHGAEKRYHHSEIGGNFRLDELQAALLRVKLPHLDRWTAGRRAAAEQYRRRLADRPGGLQLPPADAGCVWNQFVVQVPGGARDRLAAHLADRHISTAIYYPVPLHLQACFRDLGHGPGDFPHAERACDQVLALPLYPEIGEAAIDRVCAAVREFL
jgi:dTDP-4-amino-4,6-dideoxygalactose transaminase